MNEIGGKTKDFSIEKSYNSLDQVDIWWSLMLVENSHWDPLEIRTFSILTDAYAVNGVASIAEASTYFSHRNIFFCYSFKS